MSEQSAQRYPLEWPLGWPRTKSYARKGAKFSAGGRRITIFEATQRLEDELSRLGASSPVLSTNVSLRLDGRPRSDERPSDPGVAVYFRFNKQPIVFACDRYVDVAGNIAAIAAHVDALRRIERYGVGRMEQALGGYKALPADTAADWRNVFGFNGGPVSKDDLDSKFRALAREKHPDITKDDGAAMAHLNRARDYALVELEGR